MANPIYQALGNKNQNVIQQFTQFMNQMRGQDPNKIINDMVASGRISQQQLDQAQKQAQQMESMFASVRGMFGK